VAACCAFFLIVGFVFMRGIRGVAWTSLVKDASMIVALFFAGIVIPSHFFGSPTGAIRAVLREHANWMTLGRGGGEDSLSWFITTVILTTCGAFMWPHVVAASYCAKSEDAIRWNTIRLPFYQVMLLLVYIAGFSAIILRPGLTGATVDQSFMLVVQDHYPDWLLGFVAGTGCLAALIAAGSQVLAAASLLSRNIMKPLLGEMEEDRQKSTTRGMIVFVAALAMGLWLSANTTIIGLVLMGYSIITQLFPSVMFSFLARRPRAISMGAGIWLSLALLTVFALIRRNVWFGVNTGLIALVANATFALLIEWILVKLNYGPPPLGIRNSCDVCGEA
jgi:SSS family solute:Na+ symporter